jgi:hypothetical protein
MAKPKKREARLEKEGILSEREIKAEQEEEEEDIAERKAADEVVP